ncbi:MAG: hypothetical protein HY332_09110 [Chloroflexi bacterium]|nr:hypothetical protein [Chloroflexota bacterium]
MALLITPQFRAFTIDDYFGLQFYDGEDHWPGFWSEAALRDLHERLVDIWNFGWEDGPVAPVLGRAQLFGGCQPASTQ